MDAKMLNKEEHTNLETGCLLRYVQSDTEYFRLHYHDYYELFMVLKGEVTHIVNGKEQHLQKGQLLFIRDFDVHDYKSTNGEYFEFINLAFTKENISLLSLYLGDGFSFKNLLNSPFPPSVILSEKEKEKLFYSLTELNMNNDKDIVKFKMRSLLLNIFTKYFFNYLEEKDEIPLWIEITYERMKNPKNFIKGTEMLFKISGKSREHTSRCFKKYYNISPSDYVNNLRIEYSANLLTTSNLSVTNICYECGFENISWFYKAFYKKFKTTPLKYRKNMK